MSDLPHLSLQMVMKSSAGSQLLHQDIHWSVPTDLLLELPSYFHGRYLNIKIYWPERNIICKHQLKKMLNTWSDHLSSSISKQLQNLIPNISLLGACYFLSFFTLSFLHTWEY